MKKRYYEYAKNHTEEELWQLFNEDLKNNVNSGSDYFSCDDYANLIKKVYCKNVVLSDSQMMRISLDVIKYAIFYQDKVNDRSFYFKVIMKSLSKLALIMYLVGLILELLQFKKFLMVNSFKRSLDLLSIILEAIMIEVLRILNYKIIMILIGMLMLNLVLCFIMILFSSCEIENVDYLYMR